MTSFVHLHLHTEYSLLDGACSIPRLMKKVKDMGQESVAITDHGNMFGAIEFYQAAKNHSVHPIIGMEAYMAPRSRTEKELTTNGDYAYHQTLLAMDEEGYHNLCRLATIASLEGFYYRPRIDIEVLSKHSAGLIVMSGCLGGKIPFLLQSDDYTSARAEAVAMRAIFGDRYYLEVMFTGIEAQKKVNAGLAQLSRELSIPLVATNDAHYLDKADSFAHEILMCIGTKKRINDADRMDFGSDSYYVKSADEMLAALPDFPEAVEATVAVAERCKMSLKFDQHHLPVFETPPGRTPQQELAEVALAGLHWRYGPNPEPEVVKRFDYELGVINAMGFDSYFLIVRDFVDYAKKNDIPVGPGRGSAAGSLVAYATGITDIDPLKYDLLFERFLNPGRKDLPDIDIDFCQEKRYKVLDYVTRKYGDDRVAQIITFGTLGARAVIRDVGRVMEIQQGYIDRLAKMIPGGPNVDLAQSMKDSPELRKEYEQNDQTRNLLDVALRLEGLSRNASVHAAAVVIADKPLTEYLPLSRAKKDAGEEQQTVTQYSKDYVEKIGLLKMDFLGLQTLTMVEYAQRIIEESTGHRVEFDDKFDDKATYDLLCTGHTMGVFQLESRGMRELVKRLKPDCFEDIIANIALFRPGPLGGGMLDSFVNGKHGREKIEYLHPSLEGVLKNTYGMILYQEQAMRIANVIGNFSLAEADSLRKAMAKKKPEMMEKYRKQFVENAPKNGVDAATAEVIFKKIEEFAGYGFNKSHSAAYAVITYRSAYLKAHYPVEFMAAVLSSVLGSTDKLVLRIDECRQAGIEVLPPDVNYSGALFRKEGRNKIRFALGAIKGVGSSAAESVEAEAKKKHFTGLYEFCERIDLKMLNRGTIEAMIGAGALDSLPGTRKAKLAALEAAISAAQNEIAMRDSGQMGLFGGSDGETVVEQMPNVGEFQEADLLSRENAALGFFLTNHPVKRYKDLQKTYGTCRVRDILVAGGGGGGFGEDSEFGAEEVAGSTPEGIDLNDGDTVVCAVRVSTVTKRMTKDGKRMAVLTIEDDTGTVDGVVFPDAWSRLGQMAADIASDSVLIVVGLADFSREAPQVIIDDLVKPESVLSRFTAGVRITLSASEQLANEQVRWLKARTRQEGGSTYLHLNIPMGDHMACVALSQRFSIEWNERTAREFSGQFGSDAISIIPKRNSVSSSRRRNGFGVRDNSSN